MKTVLVSIILGIDSDLPLVKEAVEILKSFNIPYEVRVLSAHRSPEDVRKFARSASKRGIKVIIACAGLAAHLPGVIASHTVLPVIGVPLPDKTFKGIDSLLSILEMPSGIPVGTMSIGKSGVKNAILYSLEILALGDEKIRKKLLRFRENLRKNVLSKDKKIKGIFP